MNKVIYSILNLIISVFFVTYVSALPGLRRTRREGSPTNSINTDGILNSPVGNEPTATPSSSSTDTDSAVTEDIVALVPIPVGLSPTGSSSPTHDVGTQTSRISGPSTSRGVSRDNEPRSSSPNGSTTANERQSNNIRRPMALPPLHVSAHRIIGRRGRSQASFQTMNSFSGSSSGSEGVPHPYRVLYNNDGSWDWAQQMQTQRTLNVFCSLVHIAARYGFYTVTDAQFASGLLRFSNSSAIQFDYVHFPTPSRHVYITKGLQSNCVYLLDRINSHTFALGEHVCI